MITEERLNELIIENFDFKDTSKSFSGDIGATWELIPMLKEKGFRIEIGQFDDDLWYCSLWESNYGKRYEVKNMTSASFALCIVTLMTTYIDIEKELDL